MDAILTQLTAMQQQLEILSQQVSTLTGKQTTGQGVPGAPKKRGRPVKDMVTDSTTPSASLVAAAIEAAAVPPKPKKVLSPEHLAKLAAGREAKKVAAQVKETAPTS